MWGLLLHAFLYFLPEIPAFALQHAISAATALPTQQRGHRALSASPTSQLQTTTAMYPY